MDKERRLYVKSPLIYPSILISLSAASSTHAIGPLALIFRWAFGSVVTRTAVASTARAAATSAGLISTRAAGLSIGGKFALMSATAYTLAIQYNAQAIYIQGDVNITRVETENRSHTNLGNVVYQIIDVATGKIQSEEVRTLAKDSYQFDIQVPELNEGVKAILRRAKNQEFRSPNFMIANRENFRWES